VKIGGVLTIMFRFADDIVALTTSEEDLQMTLNVMNTTFKEYSLKINAAKTKALVCYKKIIPSINITLENKEIIQVDYFKYLGSIITEGEKSTKEIKNRIGQAKNTFLKKKKNTKIKKYEHSNEATAHKNINLECSIIRM